MRIQISSLNEIKVLLDNKINNFIWVDPNSNEEWSARNSYWIKSMLYGLEDDPYQTDNAVFEKGIWKWVEDSDGLRLLCEISAHEWVIIHTL